MKKCKPVAAPADPDAKFISATKEDALVDKKTISVCSREFALPISVNQTGHCLCS